MIAENFCDKTFAKQKDDGATMKCALHSNLMWFYTVLLSKRFFVSRSIVRSIVSPLDPNSRYRKGACRTLPGGEST